MNSFGKLVGCFAFRVTVFAVQVRWFTFLLSFWVLSVTAAEPLVVKDLDGVTRTPLEVGEANAVVLVFITHDCPVANGYVPEYRRLFGEYHDRGIGFTLVHVDPDARTERLRRHRNEFGLQSLAVVHDLRHELVRAVGAEMTPEAVVVVSGGAVCYRGRVDNLYADYGKRRREPTRRDLRNALDAILAGRPVPVARTEVIGCHIPPLRLP